MTDFLFQNSIKLNASAYLILCIPAYLILCIPGSPVWCWSHCSKFSASITKPTYSSLPIWDQPLRFPDPPLRFPDPEDSEMEVHLPPCPKLQEKPKISQFTVPKSSPRLIPQTDWFSFPPYFSFRFCLYSEGFFLPKKPHLPFLQLISRFNLIH